MKPRPEFVRIGTTIINLGAISYAVILTGGLRLYLNAMDDQGKPKRILVSTPLILMN